jgi:hypothetical protein
VSAGPLIAANRNFLFQQWEKSPCEVMVMVDDDVEWGADVLYQLRHHVLSHPVVFVDMPDRQFNTTAYVWGLRGVEPARHMSEPYYVPAFGAGMFALHREVLKSLPAAPFNHQMKNGYQLREDLSFSLELANSGYAALCIPNLDVTHHCDGKMRPRKQ